MASSSHHPHKTLPPKRPKIEPNRETPRPNPSFPTTPTTPLSSDKGKSVIPPSEEDSHLSNSSHLTRPEVLRRRAHYIRQLGKVYGEYYWALMDELRVQYRAYVWKFGLSPFQGQNSNFSKDDNNINNGGCAFFGCKYKAMALTSFCHLHILADKKQQLYKPCAYVIKSAMAGPITCGKPILRSTVPSLCNIHLQKGQKHVNQALKKAGLTVNPSTKLAPKLHVLVVEYVREIQAKRRAAVKKSRKKEAVKAELCT